MEKFNTYEGINTSQLGHIWVQTMAWLTGPVASEEQPGLSKGWD